MSTISSESGMSSAFGVLGNVFALAFGVDSRDTVTIQCLVGRSPGKYFVLNGWTDHTARYAGMRDAFGTKLELFVPSGVQRPPRVPQLDQKQYVKLLCGVKNKQTLSQEGVSPNAVVNHHTTFPLWRWSLREYSWLTWIIGPVSFVLLPLVMIFKWSSTKAFPLESIIFVVLFAASQLYVRLLLDIRRWVEYVRVPRKSVGNSMARVWDDLFDQALDGPPAGSDAAVEDLKVGAVRRVTTDLAVPVMALQPVVEYKLAEWLSLLSPIRYLLFGVSTLVPGVTPRYIIAYSLAGAFQSFLHKSYAQSFLSANVATDILWFRRMPAHVYTELVEDFRMTLS